MNWTKKNLRYLLGSFKDSPTWMKFVTEIHALIYTPVKSKDIEDSEGNLSSLILIPYYQMKMGQNKNG